jgi:hypothetical protein
MDPSSMVAGIVFSGIGFVAWRVGRSRDSARLMLLGAALIGYPFLIPEGPGWTWGTGAVLTAACLLP